MIVLPHVEIRNGVCVRPQGGADTSSVFIGDAISVARSWANTGFQRIHLVDSDAVSGTGSNATVVEDVIRDDAIDVQAADAAQSTEQIERLVSAGAVRVVVGPRGLDEPEWLVGTAEMYPGLVVLATDIKERRAVTRGWVRSLPIDIMDLVEELAGVPLGGILLSAENGNGPRGALDLALLEDIASAGHCPVIATGGVSTMNDLRALEHRGVSAVLLGESLYAGELDPHAVAAEFSE
jgi:phosphoribosylformimino-5-aminoimidazole carboxamide ribotide isomerase